MQNLNIIVPSEGYNNILSLNSVSSVSEIIHWVQAEVNNILTFDEIEFLKKAKPFIDSFLDTARHSQDTHGRSNPRVARSFMHSLLPGFRKSGFYQLLSPIEKRVVMREISTELHK